MKKLTPLFAAFILLLSLSACAPKVNNTTTQNIGSPPPTPLYKPFTLYYPSIEENRLVKETQELHVTGNETSEELVLAALKAGPKGEELKSPISRDATIRSIKTVSGLCTVDFSDDFLSPSEDETDRRPLLIQSIVHSLCQLDTVKEVKINVNGKTDTNLGPEVDLSKPLPPDETFLTVQEEM